MDQMPLFEPVCVIAQPIEVAEDMRTQGAVRMLAADDAPTMYFWLSARFVCTPRHAYSREGRCPGVGKNLLGESFLAAVGIDAFLDRGPLRVTAEQRDRAIGYPAEMRAELKAFLSSDAPDRGTPLPPFNYRKVLAQLNDFPTDPVQQQQHIAEKLAGFRVAPDAGVAFTHAAGEAVKYLQGIVPKRQRVTSTGPVLMEPNGQDISRFRRAHAAVQDPMSVFTDLREGAIAKDQVLAFSTVFPALYEDAGVSVQAILSQLKGDRPAFALVHDKEMALQKFMGVHNPDATMTRALQESFKPGADKTQGPQVPLNVSPDVTGQTPTQRIAAK